MNNQKAYYWMSHLQNIQLRKVYEMQNYVGSASELMNLSAGIIEQFSGLTEREKKIFQKAVSEKEKILDSYELLSEKGIRFVSAEEADYPARLLELPDHPVGLFLKGRLPDANLPSVAIVGARACSDYGTYCAGYFAETLSSYGLPIISGMAYGIDACSQRAAVNHKGSSYAVLGGGVDICYPKEHFELYRTLGQKGGILSESLPGTPNRSYLFPRRNRIISGMSDVLIVIEARKKSGSLITAEYAGEQGRSVFAVPGRIDMPLSQGTNELIRDGAILLQTPEELLEHLHLTMEQTLQKEKKEGSYAIFGDELDVYRQLRAEPVHLEELLLRTKYPVGMLSRILLQLNLKGYVSILSGGYYKKTEWIPKGISG